jgi:hypothetical protein
MSLQLDTTIKNLFTGCVASNQILNNNPHF